MLPDHAAAPSAGPQSAFVDVRRAASSILVTRSPQLHGAENYGSTTSVFRSVVSRSTGRFCLAFFAGVFFVVRRGGAEGGRLEGAFGFGLIAIAALGWTVQLVVEVINRALRARKRRS